MEKYDALKLENQLCFSMYTAAREIMKLYKPYLSKLDLTYTQYITLLVLWEDGIISAKDLGKKLYLDSGTLTPLLKKLEAKNLVKRKRSQEDERVMMIILTEEGKKLKEKAVEVPEKVFADTDLDIEEAMEIKKSLEGFLKNLYQK